MENQALNLFAYVRALRGGIDDWYADYDEIMDPDFDVRVFKGKALLGAISLEKILNTDVADTLPHPDEIERKYNYSNFSLNVRKAKKLQEIIALENILEREHDGADLKAVSRGRMMNMNRLSQFFQHATGIKDDPFNRMTNQSTVSYEGFDPKITMEMYEDVQKNFISMADPWSFAAGAGSAKQAVLEEIYAKRVEFAGHCAEQIAMDMAYARQCLIYGVSARLLVEHGAATISDRPLEFMDMYPELGEDFINTAKDNLKLLRGFMKDLSTMLHIEPGHPAGPTVEKYVAIDPDFGVR